MIAPFPMPRSVRRVLSGAPLPLLVAAACARGPATPPPVPAPAPAAPASRPEAPPAAVTPYDLDRLRERWLMVPVAGVRPGSIPATFLDGRVGHRHNAVDILAPRGTPVLAADDGRVLRMRSNTLGGITVYAVDDEERFVYYYAHLDHYAAGIAEGQRVAKGTVIGYVGTTGNAPPDTPHLHFQVMRLEHAARWWDGAPIDPLPFLALPGTPRS